MENQTNLENTKLSGYCLHNVPITEPCKDCKEIYKKRLLESKSDLINLLNKVSIAKYGSLALDEQISHHYTVPFSLPAVSFNVTTDFDSALFLIPVNMLWTCNKVVRDDKYLYQAIIGEYVVLAATPALAICLAWIYMKLKWYETQIKEL
jgi:hypothetical protein